MCTRLPAVKWNRLRPVFVPFGKTNAPFVHKLWLFPLSFADGVLRLLPWKAVLSIFWTLRFVRPMSDEGGGETSRVSISCRPRRGTQWQTRNRLT